MLIYTCIIYIYIYVCVCVCVCARAHTCTLVCVWGVSKYINCLLVYHSCDPLRIKLGYHRKIWDLYYGFTLNYLTRFFFEYSMTSRG